MIYYYLGYIKELLGLRGRALLRVAASTVACTAEGECALPVTLSMLGIAAEIVRLWVPFPLLLPGSCRGTSSSPLYGSNVGEGVGGLGSFQRRMRPFGMMLSP